MGSHPRYSIWADTHDWLIIRDEGPWDQHKTITNDPEGVVRQLVSRLQGRRLFYFDSDGRLDELVYNIGTGEFVRFGMIDKVTVERITGGDMI